MRDRRTALMWAVAWWFGRRWLRRRAALAAAGIASGATARRARIRAVVAAFVVVGALAAAFLAWRRLFAEADDVTGGQQVEPTTGAEAIPVDGSGGAADVPAAS